jgi:hypothetical protein
MGKILHKLTWYDKSTEELVGEVRLRGASPKALRKLFDLPPDDAMADCFAVEPRQMNELQRWADLRINLDKYDYFVEASAVPVQAPAGVRELAPA